MTTDTLWNLPQFDLNEGGNFAAYSPGATLQELTPGDTTTVVVNPGANPLASTSDSGVVSTAADGYIPAINTTTNVGYDLFLDGTAFVPSAEYGTTNMEMYQALTNAVVPGNEAQTTLNFAAIEEAYLTSIGQPNLMATQGDPYGVTFNNLGQLVVADQNGLAPSQEPVVQPPPPPPIHGHEGHEHDLHAQIATVLAHWA